MSRARRWVMSNFSDTAIVSLLYVMENGASAEIAVVGNEGIVGYRGLWEAIPRPARRRSKVPVKAFARCGLCGTEFKPGRARLHLLLRYTQASHHADGADRGL